MSLVLDDILTELPKLPASSLRQLRARATALLGSDAAPHADEDETFVFDQMRQALEEAGSPSMPFGVFAKQRPFPKFREGVPVFCRFVAKHFEPRSRVERTKVAGILMSMLVSRLRRMRLPVGFTTMAQQIAKVHQAVDDEFPGYRESKLLRWVVERYQV